MPLSVSLFQKQIEKLSLFNHQHKLLLAVSGGMDSMVLAHLLQAVGCNFEMAHVNYGLRADESDGDEKMIRQYAELNNIPLHIKKVEASEFEKSKDGIQATARDVRYQWFDELATEFSIDYILLAHHKNDQSETILHQFLRGGMLSALRGMRHKNGKLIRPLLSFSRASIAQYAADNNIHWREDSSNQSSKYTRNFIRKELMPMMQLINADIMDSLAKRAVVFDEIEQLVNTTIQNDIAANIIQSDDQTTIPCAWLKDYPYQRTLLWQLLAEYNFSSAQMEDVLSLIYAQTGARVESDSHTVFRDRENLLLVKNDSPSEGRFVVHELPFVSNHNTAFRLEESLLEEVSFGDERIQYVDLEKIIFPLVMRHWKDGDSIVALGMQGTQKVSDILIQKKIPLHEKKNILVLADHSGQIIAIPGMKVSELFKITSDTKRVLCITC